MMKLIDHPILIVVWSQEGCPGCADYLPKFRRVAPKYQACIPSVIVDVASHERAADHYRIRVTPMTTIMRYGRQSLISIEGDAEEAQIEALFQSAMVGMDCKVG